MNTQRQERRRQSRIRLASPLVGRVDSYGAVLLDISEGGARLEVYTRLRTGSIAKFRFDWEGQAIETSCNVLACGVARLAGGEKGATVYHARVSFVEPEGVSAQSLKRIVTTHLTRALAEQVANAKGVLPVDEQRMPIFRGEVLTSNRYAETSAQRNAHLLPASDVIKQRGYICCRLNSGGIWSRKWTRDATQPSEGFTVSVHEASDQVALLCRTYADADRAMRELIRRMAALSLESLNDE